MSIIDIFKRLIGITATTPDSNGKVVPVPRTLSASEADALLRFNDLAFDHLSPDIRPSQKKAFSELFLSGESFFAAMLSSESANGATTYLYADIKGADEAVESCASIGVHHGIESIFSSAPKRGAVEEVVDAFDQWLQSHGHRFLQDTEVDWGYAGIVVKTENIDAVLAACAGLDIRLDLGCKP